MQPCAIRPFLRSGLKVTPFSFDAAAMAGGGFNPDLRTLGAKVEVACVGHKVPPPAAALQVVLDGPAVPSIRAGTRTVKQLRPNLERLSHPIPGDFPTAPAQKGVLRKDSRGPA